MESSAGILANSLVVESLGQFSGSSCGYFPKNNTLVSRVERRLKIRAQAQARERRKQMLTFFHMKGDFAPPERE